MHMRGCALALRVEMSKRSDLFIFEIQINFLFFVYLYMRSYEEEDRIGIFRLNRIRKYIQRGKCICATRKRIYQAFHLLLGQSAFTDKFVAERQWDSGNLWRPGDLVEVYLKEDDIVAGRVVSARAGNQTSACSYSAILAMSSCRWDRQSIH